MGGRALSGTLPAMPVAVKVPGMAFLLTFIKCSWWVLWGSGVGKLGCGKELAGVPARSRGDCSSSSGGGRALSRGPRRRREGRRREGTVLRRDNEPDLPDFAPDAAREQTEDDPGREARRSTRRRRELRPRVALLRRSRGGWTSEVHLAADRGCRPPAFVQTAGQTAVGPRFIPVLDQVCVRGPVGRPRTRPGRGRRGQGAFVPAATGSHYSDVGISVAAAALGEWASCATGVVPASGLR